MTVSPILRICSLIEDEYLSTTNGSYIVAELADSDRPLLDEALVAWRTKEDTFRRLHALYLEQLNNFGWEPNPIFDEWFCGVQLKVADGTLLSGPLEESDLGNPRILLRQYLYGIRLLVTNINVCRCFAILVPEAVPNEKSALARTGRTMCQVFYLELLGKALDTLIAGRQPNIESFSILDSYIRRADELIHQ